VLGLLLHGHGREVERGAGAAAVRMAHGRGHHSIRWGSIGAVVPRRARAAGGTTPWHMVDWWSRTQRRIGDRQEAAGG
jgi:hypothetical protein